MIVVRMVFQAKWGKSNEAVEEFAKMEPVMRRFVGPNARMRVLTDLSGPFHTVVQEVEVESLAKWEQIRTAMFSAPEMQDMPADMEMPFDGGRTEYYTLEKSW